MSWLDTLMGRAAAKADAPKPEAEIGATGLSVMGGRVYEESNRNWTGVRKSKTIAEMRRTPMLHAALFAIRNLILRSEWKVEIDGDDPEDLARAEFVESCLDDMNRPWRQFVGEVVTTVLSYGFAPYEKVFKFRDGPGERVGMYRSRYDDGKIGIRKLAPRHPDTIDKWEFDAEGGVRGLYQSLDAVGPGVTGTVFVPIDKLLLFVNDSEKGNPEGHSTLIGAHEPWYYRKHIMRILAIGIERDCTGIPIARIPGDYLAANASADKRAVADMVKKIVENVRNDEQAGVVLPDVRDDKGNQLFSFELLSSPGQRQFPVLDVVRYLDFSMALAFLADFLMLGHEKIGSFALSESKTSIFGLAIDGWNAATAEPVNKYLIPDLLRSNGMTLENMPRVVPQPTQSNDPQVVANFIDVMARAGHYRTDGPFAEWAWALVGAPGGVEESIDFDGSGPAAPDGGSAEGAST